MIRAPEHIGNPSAEVCKRLLPGNDLRVEIRDCLEMEADFAKACLETGADLAGL